MAYWLLKTEPGTYSIDDLERDGVEGWEGVRNPMAKVKLDAMKVGDLAFFYHSSCSPPGIAGVCEIVRGPYSDVTALDPTSRYFDKRATPEKPRWTAVQVRFVEKFPRFIPIGELRAAKGLQEWSLLRWGRLSVHSVEPKHWKIVMRLAHPAELIR